MLLCVCNRMFELFKSQTYESPLNATERKEKAASVFVALHTTQPGRWWRGAYLGADFGLAVTVAAVVARAAAAAVAVVVVRAGISIFVHSIQKPEKEFQGVVLRVPSKLRAVLRHYTLKREQTLIRHLGKNFWSHYMVALWQIGATMITWCSWFVSENCFSWGHSLRIEWQKKNLIVSLLYSALWLSGIILLIWGLELK